MSEWTGTGHKLTDKNLRQKGLEERIKAFNEILQLIEDNEFEGRGASLLKQELQMKIGSLQNCLPDDHGLQTLDQFEDNDSTDNTGSEEVLEQLEQQYSELNEEANRILGLINALKFDAIDPENIDVDEVTTPL